ncbi:MAG: IS200/IS605 family transposase [Anaeroplasmataceae bacterium]|nr:IS200/IS605 family transposase [Anaeroplasmataceae bacterium]
MANKTNSLAHTTWLCKYHIVFIPKYRRKEIYSQVRKDLKEIIKQLCKYKGVEIIEAHAISDHIHMLPKIVISSTVGLNAEVVKEYIRNQEKEDMMEDILSTKEYKNPFKG